MIRMLLLTVLVPTLALADDYDDIDRLCRPGSPNEPALQATFEAEGWVPGSSHGADLILGLAMISPFLGDLDPSVFEAAPDRASTFLSASMNAVVGAPILQGPDNTTLALLPFERVDHVQADGALAQRTYVTCLAVFDSTTSHEDLTNRLASQFGNLDEAMVRLAWSNVEGLAGTAMAFEPKPEAFAWPLTDYQGGPILYVRAGNRN